MCTPSLEGCKSSSAAPLPERPFVRAFLSDALLALHPWPFLRGPALWPGLGGLGLGSCRPLLLPCAPALLPPPPCCRPEVAAAGGGSLSLPDRRASGLGGFSAVLAAPCCLALSAPPAAAACFPLPAAPAPPCSFPSAPLPAPLVDRLLESAGLFESAGVMPASSDAAGRHGKAGGGCTQVETKCRPPPARRVRR